MELYIDQISCSLLDCASGVLHKGELKDDFSELDKKMAESFIKKAFSAGVKDAFLTQSSPVWLRRQQDMDDLNAYLKDALSAWYDMKMKAGLHEVSAFLCISYQRDGMDEVLFVDSVLQDALIVQAVVSDTGLDHQMMKINSVMTSSLTQKDLVLCQEFGQPK